MTNKTAAIQTEKGRVLRRQVLAAWAADDEVKVKLNMAVPRGLFKTIDKLSKHTRRTRTAVVITLLDAILAEIEVQSAEDVKKLFSKGEFDAHPQR